MKKRVFSFVMACLLLTMLFTNVVFASSSDPCIELTDVDRDAWYHSAIDFAIEQDLFKGTSATTFSPDEFMTRGMFVTVMGRMSGANVENKTSTQFKDVSKNQYYAGYVKWANDNGLVYGTSATTFEPENNISREDICTMLIRYSEFASIPLKKSNTDIKFKDAASISNYARAAVTACQQSGVINGEKISGGFRFRPQSNATRAEVAMMIKNFYDNAAPVYQEGIYEVGTDIPAGQYMLIDNANTDARWASFVYSTDPEFVNVIKTEYFNNYNLIQVNEGEYLRLQRCRAVPLEFAPTIEPTNNAFEEGYYTVGVHIPSGTYELQNPSTTDGGYCLVYSDLRRISYTYYDMPPEQTNVMIQLSDGNLVYLAGCKMIFD